MCGCDVCVASDSYAACGGALSLSLQLSLSISLSPPPLSLPLPLSLAFSRFLSLSHSLTHTHTVSLSHEGDAPQADFDAARAIASGPRVLWMDDVGCRSAKPLIEP
jgi:hypothetical protein